MDTPREFDKSTCFFSSVDGTDAYYYTHRPIANQIRIQIVPSVDSSYYRSLFLVCHQLGSMAIREYGSTLYVGLARAVAPTNTNFRLTFLLTRLQEALYEDLAV